MKTYNVVFFGKGGYVDARIGGRQVSSVYCKTRAEIAAKVADLKVEGYEESK